MNIKKFLGNEKLPTIIKDPFKKNCVKQIYVYYSHSWIGDKWEASGSVQFTNGNTKGEQLFSGDTFDEVVMKIKNFIDNELE